MGVSSLEPGREKDLRHHLTAALSALPEHSDIQALASQLEPLAVVPLLGAGASHDCGMRLAWEIAKDLYAQYKGSAAIPNDHADWCTDLGRVADAIVLAQDEPRAAVDEVGFSDPMLWPGRDQLAEHFCGYRILARMAREDMLEEAITFNYDCGFEAGLQEEGFQLGRMAAPGRRWLDHATVVADHATHCKPRRRGAFVLNKVHGCAARYRETESPNGNGDAWESLIVRWSQLLDWRTDFWARDVFADRARRNVLLLVGFSGQDPVIHAALNQVLRELNKSEGFESPRVVVLDKEPKKLALQMLIKEGKGDGEHDGAITHLEVGKEGLTPTLTLLFSEMLAKRIEPALARVGVELPGEAEERLASLVVSTPAAMRWAFMIRRPDPERDAGQRINLEQAANNGYVPQTADPYTAAYSMLMRQKLRTMLGQPPTEKIDEAIAAAGFVLAPHLGKAYLPTGLRSVEFGEVTPQAISAARSQLTVPKGLDCVAVGQDHAGAPLGIAISTGGTVPVP